MYTLNMHMWILLIQHYRCKKVLYWEEAMSFKTASRTKSTPCPSPQPPRIPVMRGEKILVYKGGMVTGQYQKRICHFCIERKFEYTLASFGCTLFCTDHQYAMCLPVRLSHWLRKRTWMRERLLFQANKQGSWPTGLLQSQWHSGGSPSLPQ